MMTVVCLMTEEQLARLSLLSFATQPAHNSAEDGGLRILYSRSVLVPRYGGLGLSYRLSCSAVFVY